MNTESGTTRWWEYYLPCYLMPSVAGVAIVSWLCSYGGDGMRSLLSLPPRGTPLDTTSLILLLLYGNLFCLSPRTRCSCFMRQGSSISAMAGGQQGPWLMDTSPSSCSLRVFFGFTASRQSVDTGQLS